MSRYSHSDVLDNGIKYIKDNCDKVILVSTYSTIYADVNGSKKVAEAALVTGDFAIAGADITGTATSGGASTLTDTTKTWTVNDPTFKTIEITGGTGAGQVRAIASNTATQVTTTAAWTTAPDATSTYKIAMPRVLTATLTGKSGGNALQAVSDGTLMRLAFVDTVNSKVLHVTDETSDQAIVNGNPVQFNSNPTISAPQPTA